VNSGKDYPIELGWAFLLVVGYLVRVAFVSIRLPGAIGILLVGFAFSHFMQEDILENRNDLQRFAFLLVLLNAGFEVSIRRLRPAILLIALLPGLVEMAGIAGLAMLTHDVGIREGLVLGCVLFPLGEGLVIPKMNEFKAAYPDHALPRVTLTWAPLEATLALSFFSFLSSVSSSLTEGQLSPVLLVIEVVVRLVATVAAGGFVGAGAGWVLSHTSKITFRKKRIFTGSAVEAFLLVLGLGFGGFGLAKVVPDGFGPGSKLFDPDLFVIAVGSSFSDVADPTVLHNVEGFLAGIWVFGSIILFSMLGSRTEVQVFEHFPQILPFMLVGVACRFVGLCVAVPLAQRLGKHSHFDPKKMLLEILFLFLCSLPRATLQGALGAQPVQDNFFSHLGEQGKAWRQFIGQGSRLYIITFSILGSLLLEFLGPKLLLATADKTRRRAMSSAMPAIDEEHASCAPSQIGSPFFTESTPLSPTAGDRSLPSNDAAASAAATSPSSAAEALSVTVAGEEDPPTEDTEMERQESNWGTFLFESGGERGLDSAHAVEPCILYRAETQ